MTRPIAPVEQNATAPARSAMSRRTLLQGGITLLAAHVVFPGRAIARSTINLSDLGLQAGEAVGPDVEGIATSNRAVFARAIGQLRERGGGTLVVPDGRFPISTLRPDNVRRRRARFAIDLANCHGVRFTGRNGRSSLVRLEQECEEDAEIDATLAINGCTNVIVEGLHFEGQQTSDVKKFTTGTGISVLYGSTGVVIRDVTCDKGTQGIGIGINMPVRSANSVDLAHPVKDVTVSRVRLYNGEHGILVNVAEGVRIDNVIHTVRSYTYGGVEQPDYIQRGIYLLGCRDVVVRSSSFRQAHKTAVLMAAYPARRSYSDVYDITLSELSLECSCPREIDHHLGIEFSDQNLEPGPHRAIRSIKVERVKIAATNIGVHFRERDTRGELAGSAFSDISFSECQVTSNIAGIAGVVRRAPRALTVSDSLISVEAAPKCSRRPPSHGFRLERTALAEPRVEALNPKAPVLAIRRSRIVGGATGLKLRRIDGVRLEKSLFRAGEVAGPRTLDVQISDCKNVFVEDSVARRGLMDVKSSPSAAKGWRED